MTPDLLQSYFERDLSEEEMLRLSSLLEDGQENAERFVGLAAAAFAALKIPELRPARHLLKGLKGLGPMAKAILAAVTGAGISVAAWQGLHKPEAAAVSVPSIVAPVATVAVPHAGHAAYDSLSVLVQQPKQGLVTVRVLDSKGTEIRLLFAGVLEKGNWRFSWDGIREDGRAALPGPYRIQVKAGPVEQVREIEIKAN